MQYQEYLQTPHWKDKRIAKLAKNPVCRICKSSEGLNIHHKFYKDRDGNSSLFNERRVDLITLCASCHKLWHLYCHEKRDKKGRPNYSKKILGIRELLSYGVSKSWAFRIIGMDLWLVARGKIRKLAKEKNLGIYKEQYRD